MKTQVIITFELEGLHNWPQAKDVFPDVGFLSDMHRHMFHFKLAKRVTHDDRDVEFIRWKRQVIQSLTEQYGTKQVQGPLTHPHGTPSVSEVPRGYLHFGSNSCEMLAKQLLTKFDCDWVEVWEDGENGARVEN